MGVDRGYWIMISRIRKFVVADRRGVAAIEFGLLTPAFFMLMIAIFEICYFVYMSTATQRAVEKAVFDIRTNHAATVAAQNGFTIKQWYRDAICSRVNLSTCEHTLVVSLELYDDDMNPIWSTSDPDQLTLGPREALMRVEARLEMPTVMFTEYMFGDEAAKLGTGITFMTEP